MSETQLEIPTNSIYRTSSDELNIAPFLNESLQTDTYEIFSLAGDASSRRYYRVVHNETSLVLMAWEPFQDADSFPFLNVQKRLKDIHVHVPDVVSLDEKRGLILLEDLGDLTLERRFWENQDQTLSLTPYKLAIDELIKIHFQFKDTDHNSVAHKIRFDHEKFMWEMNYAIDHLLVKFLNLNLSEKTLATLRSELSDMCTTLASEPTVICHRDYHSRNVMIKLGKMRVIDFQDARLGPMQYDLVSLLKDSYVDMNAEVRSQLLDYYLARREELGHAPVQLDHFMEIYELQTIQRCFKACGSFSSFFNMRQDTRYLKYLSKTLAEVKSNLYLFPKLSTLLHIFIEEGLTDLTFEMP